MATLGNAFLFLLFVSLTYAADIHIKDFGAKGDGKTDASPAFRKAWAVACSSHTPVTIYVPRKRYLLSQVIFKGPCLNSGITFRIDGILVAPDYKKMGSIDNWVIFDNVDGVTIIGGYLDGQGSSLWACKGTGHACPAGASVRHTSLLNHVPTTFLYHSHCAFHFYRHLESLIRKM